MSNLKCESDTSCSYTLGNQYSNEKRLEYTTSQNESCLNDTTYEYESEQDGNASKSDHCKLQSNGRSSNTCKKRLLSYILSNKNKSCTENPGCENKNLNSGDHERVLGEKVMKLSKKNNKSLKHNSKIWDNLKYSSEAVNSETCSGYTVIKRKKESINANEDKSEIPAGFGFSSDLSDTIKQSLQKIVHKGFTKARNDNGDEEDGDICLGNRHTIIACQNQIITDDATCNILDDESVSCRVSYSSETESINQIDLSNYPIIGLNQESENSNSLPDQLIHKPKRYGQRPQICGHCGKLFLDPYNFKQHLLIHSGEKPFKCDICGRGFSRNNHLTRHILIHTGEKPFHCDICGSDFSRSSTLALHKRSHTKEKNYNCKVCGKDFTLYWNLVVHLRIHTGERPFKCEICHKTSRQKSDFNRHMKTHSGEKPFTCYTCNTKFSRSSCLKRHWKKFHPDKPIEENVSPECSMFLKVNA